MKQPLICTPLRVEQAAVRSGLPGTAVGHTGMGARRSTDYAATVRGPRPVLVAGVGGALTDAVAPGELVVATEVRGPAGTLTSPSAPLLAGALRRAGLRVHEGPVVSTPRVTGERARAALAAAGALAVDMESAQLGTAAGGGPFAAVRVIVDSPAHPLLHHGTPLRGVHALRALRAAAPAMQQWTAATGTRDVVLAGSRSFCAGVGRAIETVERALARHGAPVYVRRQIVHNAHVVADLQRRGAVFVTELDEVPPGAVAVLAAHGVSPVVREQARSRELVLIDATCPLVSKVHTEVRRYAGLGKTVFLIGHAEHEEVQGTAGEAPGTVVVVEDAAHAERVHAPDPERVAYVMQTTLATDEAEQVAAVLRQRFPALSAPRSDDICYATTNRQRALRAITAETELVLVLGSGNSSNSRRLVEVAERDGAHAHLVDDAGAVDLRWLTGVRRVGITAGASAPPHLVDELVHCLSGLGPLTVREAAVVHEDIRFTLPRESTQPREVT